MENQVQNIVRLTGFAGNDPVISNLSNNKKVARLSMAVNESYRNFSGEEVRKTQWFNLVFWGAKVEAAEQLIKKGTRFSIEGKLNNNTYLAKDGSKRYAMDVYVNEIITSTEDTGESAKV